VTSDPTRRVEITVEAEFLFVGDHVGVTWIHVLRWWWNLLFVERGVEIRRVA
jgi:hypothetical protein